MLAHWYLTFEFNGLLLLDVANAECDGPSGGGGTGLELHQVLIVGLEEFLRRHGAVH